MKVQTWDSLHHAKFCKNGLRGYTPFGHIYTKKYQFWGLLAHIFKPIVVKVGVKVRTGTSSPKPNFVKIA